MRNNETLKTASEHMHKGKERIHQGTKSSTAAFYRFYFGAKY